MKIPWYMHFVLAFVKKEWALDSERRGLVTRTVNEPVKLVSYKRYKGKVYILTEMDV